jgi:ribulose-5-phosphate 4-epimerase/fuculose-1-phosphate aldolase
MKSLAAKIRLFVENCHRVGAHDLVRCSSGNLSWRVDAERMLVTATRTWLPELTAAQVSVLRLRDGAQLNPVKPSVEAGFHRGVLLARPDMDVALHFQSPFVMTLSCCAGAEKKNFFVIPEIPYYIGAIAFVPFLQPGSDALARAVTAALGAHDMVVMRNHGATTVGKNFDDAIQKAVFFELACQAIVLAGKELRAMSRKASDFLQGESGRGV